MRTAVSTIWGLWPNIVEMAHDLNDSATILQGQKECGLLPDERHDDVIVARAMYLGALITKKDIVRLRRELRPREAIKREREWGESKIAELVERCGGPKAVSDLTGLTAKHVKVIRARGKIPARLKGVFRDLAERHGMRWPEDI